MFNYLLTSSHSVLAWGMGVSRVTLTRRPPVRSHTAHTGELHLGFPPLMHTPRPTRRPKPNADSSHDVELLSTALAPHHFWLLCTGIMLFGMLSVCCLRLHPLPTQMHMDARSRKQKHSEITRTVYDPPPIFTCAGSVGNRALAPDEGMLPTAPHSELLLLLLLRLIHGSPSAHCPRRRARRRNHRVCTLPTRSPPA